MSWIAQYAVLIVKLRVYISSYLNRMILICGGFLRRNLFSLDMDYSLMELPITSPSGLNFCVSLLYAVKGF
jgi:hypothetical protein